ncbi:DNA-binding transcriptional regulator YhcF (GntR family) [Salirhabdus euzebyi]|uniref:DNA-binding transcriptional regulator YhcF (GntR family) n=1 Tax=Salirhabdus euzebyi TaxID=394506 RepID=A0A841QB23_9BACI|nr:GntR family transcriptional regulator [Salirhabdus euzebyi]MBB6455402.1 DNA-binding transcriptional regulator YhcF (GntR family) [Salirhabdus euzebyi]
MTIKLEEDRPIFQQITNFIQNEIVVGRLKEEDKIPSTNEMAKFYQINPATAAKGINVLVDKGVIYKKRGIGMFVSPGSKQLLIKERQKKFFDEFVKPLLEEADRIELSLEEVLHLIKERDRK